MMSNALEMMMLDFFEFHSDIISLEEISSQNASLVNRFMELLEEGNYSTERNISFYADKLCVTPIYMSEVVKKVSGFAANYRINRYTVRELAILLRDPSISLSELADMFNFSSQSYFSRYVLHHPGISPSALREK